MKKNEILALKTLTAFGVQNQKQKAIEELAELITILAQETTKNADPKDVITEIADVQILLDQLKIVYGKTAVVKEIAFKSRKICKLLKNFAISQRQMAEIYNKQNKMTKRDYDTLGLDENWSK